MTATPGHFSQDERESLQSGTRRIGFRSILAATDFSPTSATTMGLAVGMAKQFQARLYLLHAVLPENYAVGIGEVPPTLEQFNLQNARESLHKYATQIPDLGMVKYEEMVSVGSPGSAIESAVETKGIDLLVLGSHGRRGLAKWALGSTAKWAIQSLHCPVLVAGPQYNQTPHPIKSLVFATDLAAESLRSAEYAGSIAREYNAAITFVHVRPEASPTELEAERTTIEKMRELLPGDGEEWRTSRSQVENGDVAAAVLHSAQINSADMIVLGAQQKSLQRGRAPWGTLSEVIRGAHCAVLVVPTP